MRFAAIILDALGPYNLRQLDLPSIRSMYNEYPSGIMTTSGLAHTPISNSRIWGQYVNNDKIWVEFSEHRWTGGVDGFDPVERVQEDEAEFYSRGDFETTYIWDVLDYRGYDACALGIPICLPPYSFNAKDQLENAWFPHTEEMLKRHLRRKFEIFHSHLDDNPDFICTSIKVPDQWLHGIGSGMVDELFVSQEAEVLDDKFSSLVKRLESEGYDWVTFGDHGSPIGGRTANYTSKNLLARHRKDAAIMGSVEDLPRYTDYVKPFILDYFGVEDIPFSEIDIRPTNTSPEADDAAIERLQSLGYL